MKELLLWEVCGCHQGRAQISSTDKDLTWIPDTQPGPGLCNPPLPIAWGSPAACYSGAAASSPLQANSLENTPWPCQNPLRCACPCPCSPCTPLRVAASLPDPSSEQLHPLFLPSLRLPAARSPTSSGPSSYCSPCLRFTCSLLGFLNALNFYLQLCAR